MGRVRLGNLFQIWEGKGGLFGQIWPKLAQKMKYSDKCKNSQFSPPENDMKEIGGLKTQNLPLFFIYTHILALASQKLRYPSFPIKVISLR